MCFSAEASFAVGAGLIPAGAYCIYSAWRKRPSYLTLAVVPLFFGIQQISEGFVWEGLEHRDETLVRQASLVFLFFALALWPFWFSFLGAHTETDRPRRRLFIALAAVSTFWFWVLYLPLVVDAESYLSTYIVHHSIQYDIFRLPVYKYISVWPLRVFYFLCVAIPMAAGSSGIGHRPGLVFAATALVVGIFYGYAFVSVWCFFAALMTFYLIWVFHSMPGTSAVALNAGREKVEAASAGVGMRNGE